LKRARGEKIVVVNKIELLNWSELRRLKDRMKSRRIAGVVVSALSGEGIDKLKDRMMELTGMIRVYMKEPGKEKEKKPMVLKKGARVRDVAENILKGFSLRVKETKITGPSGKFPNQRVGLNHEVKDLDVIEFHTR